MSAALAAEGCFLGISDPNQPFSAASEVEP